MKNEKLEMRDVNEEMINDHSSLLTSHSSFKMDLYAALALLKPDERTCITLQLIDGYDIQKITEITGIKEGTVKSHLSRGKDKMATYLKNNGYDRR
jgi:RNA polymerase sigma-70 factor (ECF subfamily)